MGDRDLQNLKIGIGRGMGMTLEQTAEWADCSLRKVSYQVKEPEIISMIALVEQAKNLVESRDKNITVETYKQSLEDLLSDCRAILKQALKSDDLNIALRAIKQVEDRIFGAPTQNFKSQSVSMNYQVYQLPGEAIKTFLGTAKEVAAIKPPAPALPAPEAVEAEVVDN